MSGGPKLRYLLEHVAVLGAEEHLIDIDAGPGVNDALDYLLAPLLVHLRHLVCLLQLRLKTSFKLYYILHFLLEFL